MKTEIQKLLNLKKFIKIVNSNEENFAYSLGKPSTILLQNVQSNWLDFILSKTQKAFPVFLDEKNIKTKSKKTPYAFIHCKHVANKKVAFFKENQENNTLKDNLLMLNVFVPEQDTMQYFIQWQRYRKYWWSSITTTPSLFSIGDIKYADKTADVNIIAKFPWGNEVVETISTKPAQDTMKKTILLSCSFSSEKALFTLLLDGLTNSTEEGYLRLHRTMAPYKFSFVLNKDSKNKDTLKDLANLLHNRLSSNKISSWLPDFTLSTESQLKESLELGVAYTVVLTDDTLSNGIFHLLNSSTMLQEQIHVADFDNYAALICRR